MIRHAKISDIPDILHITKACAIHMIEKRIYQWNVDYPSRRHFENDINRKELYILLVEKIIIGTIVLSSLMDEEYKNVKWRSKNDNNLYIHRLAIHPDFQGKGYAQMLMSFAEKYAKEEDYSSIRLDTFSQNKRNQKFYESRGYQRLDDIFFPKQSKDPFHCYELLI
ncbi:GNAT family N-acetyltransferase [Aurantibacter sp.]|uniref:GNAT family N-acetyltransferase n=1 Tax=Aurantibacter sp. TaxID=2807103 RepID=UPI00326326EC